MKHPVQCVARGHLVLCTSCLAYKKRQPQCKQVVPLSAINPALLLGAREEGRLRPPPQPRAEAEG